MAEWVHQQGFIRISGSDGEGVRIHIYCDSGAPESFISEDTVRSLAFQDEIFRVAMFDIRKNPRWNYKYQRALHKFQPASVEPGWIKTTKWRFCHHALVKTFGFLKSTTESFHIGHDTHGKVYFVGRIAVEYRFVNDPDGIWTPIVLPVVPTRKVRDINIVMGTDSTVHEKPWFEIRRPLSK